MKKHNFSTISKDTNIKLKEFLKKFENSKYRKEKIFFYTKTKENVIYIYELEKSKLKEFFEGKIKISDEKLAKTFSQIIDNDSELKSFIKTLINLKIINGYYSDIGFFYPYTYIKSKFEEDLIVEGKISLKNFRFFPQKFIN